MGIELASKVTVSLKATVHGKEVEIGTFDMLPSTFKSGTRGYQISTKAKQAKIGNQDSYLNFLITVKGSKQWPTQEWYSEELGKALDTSFPVNTKATPAPKEKGAKPDAKVTLSL